MAEKREKNGEKNENNNLHNNQGVVLKDEIISWGVHGRKDGEGLEL